MRTASSFLRKQESRLYAALVPALRDGVESTVFNRPKGARLVQFDTFSQNVVYYTVYYGIKPFMALISKENFLYWPYVVSFLVLSALLYRFRRDDVRGAFSVAVWWSRSARADYLYYLVNGILYPALVGGFLLGVPVVGDQIERGLSALFGARPEAQVDTLWVVVAYTLVYFIFYDFGRFLAHWIQHHWGVLWQFHQLHHSAESLTPLTSFRVHPVDLVVMWAGETLFAAIAYGVFAWAFPGQFGFYLFLGSHVLFVAYRFFGNLRHSHVWLSYGPLNRIFVSPAMHQIHHSYLPQHRDRNMGFALSIWDQWFGTAYLPTRREVFPIGLGDGQDDGRWHSLAAMYVEPFRGLYRLLRSRE